MPVPGPRNQFGPLPGYTNPDGETPTFFNLWDRPPPVAKLGETPGLMFVSLRGNVLGLGQIRKMWRQTVGYIPASGPYSWTVNGNTVGPGDAAAFQITRALRYMTRSVYMGSGFDSTRFPGYHTAIEKQNRGMAVTVGAGANRNRPTVRNRVTSFGSRVPTLNQPINAAEDIE